MAKAIYFDMDGTIADTYAVENWLDKLRAYDPSPYMEAKPLVNMSYFARLLNKLQRNGYVIGVISWGSKVSTDEYDALVEQAKRDWLRKHLPSVHFDEIHITPYGISKAETALIKDGILFDDNNDVRRDWRGISYSEQAILEVLKDMLTR